MIQPSRAILFAVALVGYAPRPVPEPEPGPAAPRTGAVAAPYCPGERFTIRTPPLSSEPYIELTVNGRTGPFLVDYGATESSVTRALLPTGTGPVTLPGPKLPGLPARNRFAVSDVRTVQQGVGEQFGLIGTDLLSKMVVEMRFENANDEHLVVSDRCDTSGLGARGFWRFDQTGFFGANTTGQTRANVPVLHIDFQKDSSGPALGLKTWAQIDPGYGDWVWPYSIDINDAYYMKLSASGPPLVLIDSTSVKDCKGDLRTDRVYVMPGHRLRIEARDGQAMYRHSSFHLVRKGRGSGQCGGIATISEPAAQFGASFLRVFGRMIFDPANKAVWILPTTFKELVPGGP